MTASRTHRLLPTVAVAALALSMSAGVAAAGTRPASGRDLVTVPQGAAAGPLAAGTEVGATDPSTPMDVSVVLRARDLTGLESRVAAGWRGPYLSAAQFADEYGQAPSVVAGIEHYLNGFGIATSAYSDRLDISATGTAGQFDKALDVSLRDYRVKAASATLNGASRWKTVHGTLDSPQVPSRYAGPILAILGLSSYSPYTSQALPAAAHQLHAGKQATGSLPAGELSPEDFVTHYNLAPLEAQGAKGQGETIGIVTLAAIDPSVPLAFWNDYLGLNESPSRLTLIPVDGGAPGPSAAAGSDETDLDVEQSGAIAPRANIRLYEAPNTDPGFADAFFAAASDNLSDTVSVSWGESETYIQDAVANGTETAAYPEVFDEVFAELGAQGQSNFTATGDYGAYTPSWDIGTTNLGVDNPGDSPYTTAAGGTTLPGTQTYGVFDSSGDLTSTESVNIPAERSWSWDYLWPLYKVLGLDNEADAATSLVGGGAGGYSVLEPRPSYQRNVSAFNDREYLTPTDYERFAPGLTLPTEFSFDPAPPLRAGYSARGRAVPDVSTNADPQTGYAVYDPTLFASSGGFALYGGTSFVAPQLNAANAVIDSALGHRDGFWNPRIYSIAGSHGSPFTPLDDTTVYTGRNYLYQTSASGVTTALPGEFSNNNLYYTGRARATWNPASGLGIPNLTALAGDLGRR